MNQLEPQAPCGLQLCRSHGRYAIFRVLGARTVPFALTPGMFRILHPSDDLLQYSIATSQNC